MTDMQSNSPYQHGGAPARDLARFNLPEGRPVLDFSVNINCLGPPPVVGEKWMAMLPAVEQYPGVESGGAALYYRERFGIAAAGFLAGNGSTEMIYLAPRILRPERVAVFTPSYHDYERAALLSGAAVTRIPLSPGDGFSAPDRDSLSAMLGGVDAVFMGRPNNPTGALVPKETVLDLAETFPETWFLIDEAFIQFMEDWEQQSLLFEKPRRNLLIIHSLTKFYAVAGLRLGGIAGAPETISRLREAKEPWTVNAISDRIAPLLLECNDYDEMTRQFTRMERERLLQELAAIEGIRPFSGRANFILCQWRRTRDLDDLLRHLLSHGVYVRDCRNFPGLETGFFRMGLRRAEENERLLSLFASFTGS